jgi:hypothetical protein
MADQDAVGALRTQATEHEDTIAEQQRIIGALRAQLDDQEIATEALRGDLLQIRAWLNLEPDASHTAVLDTIQRFGDQQRELRKHVGRAMRVLDET